MHPGGEQAALLLLQRDVGNIIHAGQDRADGLLIRLRGKVDLTRRKQAALQLVRLAKGEQLPVRDDEDLLADRLHLGEDVRAEDDRVRLPELADEVADLDNLQGVEADRRFVQNNHLGAAEQRLRDADALPVALGQGGDAAVRDLADLDLPDHLADLPVELFAPQPLGLPDKPQVFQRGLVQIERRLLGQVTDQALGLLRLGQNIKAAHRHAARCRRQAAGHNVHGGRLARAVRPEEAVNMAFGDLEGQVVDREKIAVVFCQVFDLYHGRTSSPSYALRPGQPAPPVCGSVYYAALKRR